jgi:hypothetical protein
MHLAEGIELDFLCESKSGVVFLRVSRRWGRDDSLVGK